MNNKIIMPILILASTSLLANFDNFTNWGDVPVASESAGESISSEVIASFSGFEAGRKNGAPASPSAPLVNGEFHTLESDKDVVIVSSVVEFPQRLKSKQTIKIKLGTRPLSVGAALKFAIISEKLKRNEFMTYRFDDAERPLLIKLNGQVLYHRNISDGRVEQEVFIPFFMFDEEGENNLEICNEGNLVLSFDYLRVQLATEGQKSFVAFVKNQILPKPLLVGSPKELVELSLPTTPLTDVPFLGHATPPQSFEDAYSAMNEFFTLGYVRDKKYGEEFNKWAAELSRVVKNKKLPYVRITGDLTKVDEKTAMWFLTRYGCIVGGWICDNEASAAVLSKNINGANIIAVDVRDIGKVKTAANAANTYSRTYPASVTVKGGRQDRVYGDFVQDYLVAGKNFAPSFVPYLTPLKPQVNKQSVIDNGEETITALLQILMHGGSGALIDAGEAGNNVIIEGQQQPVWMAYKKLFELTEGDGVLLPMSLCVEKHIQGVPFEDCYYAATKNSEDEITVAVLAGRGDLNREVRAVVPVPWNGAATIIQQDFLIDEIGQLPPTPNKPIKKNLKVLSPPKKKGVDIGAFKGVVSYEFKTSGLSIIKITRYKLKSEAGKKASKPDANKAKPLEKAEVYTHLPKYWRYEPIAISTNLSDLVAFTKEKISVYGPKGTGVISAKPSQIESLSCISAPESFDSSEARFVMRNAPIWDENSIFVEFSGASRKQRPGYIFNLGVDDYLKGAKGFVFFAQAEPIVSSISERLATSKDPITFAIGSRTSQLLFNAEIGKPTLIFVPYSKVMGVMNDPSIVYLMMDTKEVRDIRLELNFLSAVYENPGAEPKLAVRYDLYEKALYLLVEGDTGKPLDVLFRMKDKFKLTKASPILPHGFTQLKLDMDVEQNKYAISIEKLPNNDGRRGDVSKYFPTITGEAPQGRTRVLIKFNAER